MQIQTAAVFCRFYCDLFRKILESDIWFALEVASCLKLSVELLDIILLTFHVLTNQLRSWGEGKRGEEGLGPRNDISHNLQSDPLGSGFKKRREIFPQ